MKERHVTEILQVSETLVIGRNRLYEFAVGQLDGGRWIGFARGLLPSGGVGMFVFSEIAEAGMLGLVDGPEVVRRTAALAQDPEGGYGGVEEWFIPEEYRATPGMYRCPYCDTVLCEGRCQDYDAAFREFFEG